MSKMVPYSQIQSVAGISEKPDYIKINSRLGLSSVVVDESYCVNPKCDCREVLLGFINIDEKLYINKLFSLTMNLDDLKPVSWTVYDESIDVDEVINEFISSINGELKERLEKHYKTTKEIAEDYYHKFIDDEVLELILNGKCVSFDEVLDNEEEVTFEDGKGSTYYIHEQYCMNPDCRCNEAFLDFVKLDETKTSGENKFTMRYKLNSDNNQIIECLCEKDEMNSILEGFYRKEDIIREQLQKHYTEMKFVGEKILKEHKGGSKPVKVSIKVGRNDPCPCGSGKKYKKCCERK